ncbi:hypothetical protein PGB90_004513 [Kerria lacca]
MKERLLNCAFKFLNSYFNSSKFACRSCSTKSKDDILKYQNDLFNAEKLRQKENIGRIEKIRVKYVGHPKNLDLIMNKYISTPFNCAQHMYEMLVRRSALALINGEKYWDMHRPLDADCELQLLHFQDEYPAQVNKAYWRTCSFMLGSVLSNAFKENIEIILHSFPKPNVRSGSFVYDVVIPSLPNWKPSIDELRILSAEMIKLSSQNLIVERLSVNEELACKIFESNKYKLEQIPAMSDQSLDKNIVLYRIGKHIDVSRGPMVGNVSFLGRCTITAVHKLEHNSENFYRFQGVSLPKGILLNHFAYSVLEKRAEKLNVGRLPWQYDDVFHPELQTAEATI